LIGCHFKKLFHIKSIELKALLCKKVFVYIFLNSWFLDPLDKQCFCFLTKPDLIKTVVPACWQDVWFTVFTLCAMLLLLLFQLATNSIKFS